MEQLNLSERGLSQRKRKKNKESSTAVLSNNNIVFVSKNGGWHLIVEDRIDFWPSTGYWKVRKTGKQGRGVNKLLQFLKSSTGENHASSPS